MLRLAQSHACSRAARQEPLGPEPYFCQATTLPRATAPGDSFWKPGQCLRLLQVRTFTLSELLAMFVRPGGRGISRLVRSVI